MMTDLENALAMARKAEEKYRSIFEDAAEGIFQSSTDGRLLTANPAMAHILGFGSPEDLISSVHDVAAQLYASPDRREDFKNIMHKEGSVTGFECEVRHRGGETIWVSVSAHIVRDEDGEVIGYEGMVRDITERRKAEDAIRHNLEVLLALREAGQVLGSTLEAEEIASRLLGIMQRVSGLTTAVISTPNDNGELCIWRSVGLSSLWEKARYSPEAETSRKSALNNGEPVSFRLRESGERGEKLEGLCLPLRVRHETLGVLEAYGRRDLADEDTVSVLGSLASQAASALKNAWLYEELANREHRLREMVGRMIGAQEEERRRIAYEVHDGVVQTVTAAHQHLQAFMHDHSPESRQGRERLEQVATLVRSSVGEARSAIADLRPLALDDFGLAAALRLQIEAMREQGWDTEYETSLVEGRLPEEVETALFRIAQESLRNVRKHAGKTRVQVTLQVRGDHVRLTVRDWGRGFVTTRVTNGSGPGERVGLTSMQERVSLLGGELKVTSAPGFGVVVSATAPLEELSERAKDVG